MGADDKKEEEPLPQTPRMDALRNAPCIVPLASCLAQLALADSLWVQSVFGPLFLDNRFGNRKSWGKTLFCVGKLPFSCSKNMFEINF